MRIVTLHIENVRSYVSTGSLETGRINVFVGANNAGKSTVLRGIHLFQEGNRFGVGDLRLGTDSAGVTATVVGYDRGAPLNQHSFSVVAKQQNGGLATEFHIRDLTANRGVPLFPATEPNHLIVPFYSHRKTKAFDERTTTELETCVREDFSDLVAKLTRIMNPGYVGHRKYAELCHSILGRGIFVSAGAVGAYSDLKDRQEFIPVARMGDGVQHIVGMLVALVNAKNKIFLIEEPENDLHPTALKALLDLIIERSEENQFFISTHSNIVVRHLCSESESKLFRVSTDLNASIPTSDVSAVEDTPEARMEVLRELGYALSDFELREGWLILEEASAERIIREFLIPMFAPKLSRLQTVAAKGVTKVSPLFEDFRRLALYSHLQVPYKSTTWIRVDGDADGTALVDELRRAYPTWPANRFGSFSTGQFERYYPEQFADKASRILAHPDKRERFAKKRELCLEVVEWLSEDLERAKSALAASAKDVIDDLKAIEAELVAL